MGVVLGVVIVAVALAAFMLGRGTSDNKSTATTAATTGSATTTNKATTATTSTKTTSSVEDTNPPAPPAHGPYSTMGAAASYVEAQDGGMATIDPAATWQPDATLHVIHATPAGTASYGGDFYFFFVNGYLVGQEQFTSAESAHAIDNQTFAVTFHVYLPTDPHCCPSGGTSTVQFLWDGSSLVTVGSMAGATM